MSYIPRAGRADLHIHTLASDGISTIEEVLDQATRVRALDVIAITDHNTVSSAHEAKALAQGSQIEVITGSEVSSAHGHILALWINEDIKPGMSVRDTVDAIHAQGGLAFAAHPYANRAFGRFGLQSVGDHMMDSGLDGIEVYNSTPYMVYANMLASRQVLRNPDMFAAIGGSDAHMPQAVGKGVTLFPGTCAADLRHALEERRTTGVNGFTSRFLALLYLLRYPSILRQQSRNIEVCKPGKNGEPVLIGSDDRPAEDVAPGGSLVHSDSIDRADS